MIDASELKSLAHDLGAAPLKAIPKVRGVVSKGALNVKKRMQQDAAGSQHFGQIGRTIDYDLNVTAGGIEAEIGPNKANGGSASLAGLAYYGSSKPGGATVPDPILALQDEEPRFVEAMAKIAGFIFE